jgi:hypothetical protein
LISQQIIKIGRNIGADLSKLARDFPEILLPQKHKKSYKGTIELGQLAFKKMLCQMEKHHLQEL